MDLKIIVFLYYLYCSIKETVTSKNFSVSLNIGECPDWSKITNDLSAAGVPNSSIISTPKLEATTKSYFPQSIKLGMVILPKSFASGTAFNKILTTVDYYK